MILLAPISWIYGMIIRLLRWFRGLRQLHFDCKVISVGNITVGGTGKTVVVSYIARLLRKEGHRVAIVTRGYGRGSSKAADVKGMGDEPYMLSQQLPDVPVIVDHKRRRGITRAIQEHNADVVILDDGFQQWGIAKDLDIVTIDATNPFDNRHMLPAGRLREPLSALKRADVLMVTKAAEGADTEDLIQFLRRISPAAMILVSEHAPFEASALGEAHRTESLASFKGAPLVAVAAIADPQHFFRMLKGLGLHVVKEFHFPDHHYFTPDDVRVISSAARMKGVKAMVTTEKDAAKLLSVWRDRSLPAMWVVRIGLHIREHEHTFRDRLLRLFAD